jgi:heptosyltransferase-2
MKLKDIKNILAVRNDRFGEFLLNIPAFRALKQGFPGAKLTLIVDPYVRELANAIDFVDEVICRDNKKHNFREIIKFSRQLKAGNFDLCVIFNPSKEFNLISFFSGIPARVGYNRKWGFLLTHKMPDKKYLGLKHEVEYNLELLDLIGVTTQDKALSLKIDDSVLKDEFLNVIESNNLVALHPWTSDSFKQWPIDNFRELSQQLIQELNVRVVIVGGKQEQDMSREYFEESGNLINLMGKTSLVQLAALLKKCRLLISADSGPVHLASCVGVPVVAIFRNDIPGKSPKRWGPGAKESIVIEKNNLYDITVKEVFEKVKEVLNT